MSGHHRFADPGVALYDLATHFVVHCPRCDGRSNIIPHEGSWRLTCSKCFHVELSGQWYGTVTAYVSVKCRECRTSLSRSAEVTGEWAKLKTKCENCGDVCEYDATLTRHTMKNGLMCDSVFGLPLWLQKTIGDNLFWAFHYDHLNLLEQYVRAKLRERGIANKGSKNRLMFSRLPTFITRAGNREEILNMISALKTKQS